MGAGVRSSRPSSRRVIRYSQGLNHSGARASSESHESLTSEDRVRISTSAVLTVKSASLKFRSSSSVWSTRPPGDGGGPAKSGVDPPARRRRRRRVPERRRRRWSTRPARRRPSPGRGRASPSGGRSSCDRAGFSFGFTFYSSAYRGLPDKAAWIYVACVQVFKTACPSLLF